MKIKRFEELKAWQKARCLTNIIYQLTKEGEFSCDWGLRDQIRRASGSIMHNIAEGFDSGSDAEFCRFLRYAQRSATEVQSQLYVAIDQCYLSQEKLDQLMADRREVHAIIGGLIKYLTKD